MSTDTIKKQIAVITGASRGIGRAIALELADAGMDIVVNYVRNEEAAHETVKAIEAKGSSALAIQGNMGDPKEIKTLIAQSVERFGTIDILVHNAALGSFKPLHKLRLNQWDLTMDINAKAFYLLTQEVLPIMEPKKAGKILALSSLGANRFIPNYGAIGISKAALENIVRYFGAELMPKGIQVNCVSGGLVDTEAVKWFPEFEKFKNEVIERTPAGRLGKPEDLARVAAFLLSEKASWICGQTIIADGGLSLI